MPPTRRKQHPAPEVRPQSPNIRISPALQWMIGGAAVIAAMLVAYWPSLSGPFLMDDEPLLSRNEMIRASDGLYRIWFTTEPQDYWPLTNSSLYLEWRLWGENPLGYRCTNLVLHLASSLVVWIILRRLSIPGAFLAAILFAIHPANVESVAWISERKNTLSMVFFLLSILLFLRNEDRQKQSVEPRVSASFSSGFYWLSLVSFVAAMLAKGSVAILPPLLLLLIWWRGGRIRLIDIVRSVPFFLIAAVLTGVNIWFQKHGSSVEFRSATVVQRLCGAGGVIWFYLSKALLPLNQFFVYPAWNIDPRTLNWWLPLASAIGISTILWRAKAYETARGLLFAWAWFAIALIPVLGLVDVGFMMYSLVSDHYVYIAIIAVVAIVAAAWAICHENAASPWNHALKAASASLVAILVMLTRDQTALYANPVKLYQTTIGHNPNCWMAYNNLGKIWMDLPNAARSGKLDEAVADFDKVIRLNPRYAEGHYNMGLALTVKGQLSESIEEYRKAIEFDPAFVNAYNNLGNVLLQIGQTDEAIKQYQKAIEIAPRYAMAYNNLGFAYYKTDQFDKALPQLQKALKLQPDYGQVYLNLSRTMRRTGRLQEAIDDVLRAANLMPSNPEVYVEMAIVFSVSDRPAEAIEAAQKALTYAQQQGRIDLADAIKVWLQTYQGGQNTGGTRSVDPAPVAH